MAVTDRVVFVLSCVLLREDYLPFRINDPFVVACLCVCDCLPRGQFVNSVCDFLVVVPPLVLSIKILKHVGTPAVLLRVL